MNIYDYFSTENEDDGQWVEYDGLGCKIKIARQGGKNTLWEKEMLKLMKKHGDKDLELSDDKELNEDMTKAFAKGVIRAWQIEDKKGKDGKPIYKEGIHVRKPTGEVVVEAPTLDNILQVLRDLPELYKSLSDIAGDWKRFRKQEEDAKIKN